MTKAIQPSSVVSPETVIQELIDRYAIAGANLLGWLTEEDERSIPKVKQRVAGLPVFPPSETDWRDWANDVACRSFFRALHEAKEKVAALSPPRDDVRELLRDIANEVRDEDGAGTLPTDLMDRIDTALSQTDEQPCDDVREGR